MPSGFTFFVESDPICAELLDYQINPQFYTAEIAVVQVCVTRSDCMLGSTLITLSQNTIESGDHNKECSDVAENPVFDRFRHRRHLGHFYIKDLSGAQRELERRQAAMERKKHSVLYRLVGGAYRGLSHFLYFLVYTIPRTVCRSFQTPVQRYEKIEVKQSFLICKGEFHIICSLSASSIRQRGIENSISGFPDGIGGDRSGRQLATGILHW